MTLSGQQDETRVYKWRIIDGIAPFMRFHRQKRINWSKIIFSALKTEGDEAEVLWQQIHTDMKLFIRKVKEEGYNAVTLDDVAHLTCCENYEPDVLEQVKKLSSRMREVISLIKSTGMKVLVTTDVVPMTSAIEYKLNQDPAAIEDWFVRLIKDFINQNPEVDGVILRLGEGDGKDVKELFHSGLFAKSAETANKLLKRLLPSFEKAGKVLVCRNWTVGAHSIGDLIWHRRTLSQLLEGIDSSAFIFSLKYGESDFFRYLPLNKAFFRTNVQKVIEFQARREYEGAGEYPSFVGYDVEVYAKQLAEVENMVGFSVWCQTGGWHAFRRIAFLDDEAQWIEQNVSVISAIMGEGMTVHEWIGEKYADKFSEAEYFFRLNDKAIKFGLYINEFAQQKWFFRRTRIPPLLHVYWDCVFVNHPVRKMMRHFVQDPEAMLGEAEEALEAIATMQRLAQQLDWQEKDIEFMFDTFNLVYLAKQYYVNKFTDEVRSNIKKAKQAYKAKYPRSERQRYRIKVDYKEFKFSLSKLSLVSKFMLRKRRGYRLLDHLLTLHLLRYVYRIFKRRNEKKIPKFMRESAMGVDVLFE